MARIVEANVMKIQGRGSVCLAELDECPDALRHSCTVGGEAFRVFPVHIRWDDSGNARPVVGLALED